MAKINPLSKTMKLFDVDSSLQGLFKFNLFSENIEFDREPVWDANIKIDKNIDDEDFTQIRYYLSNIHDWEPSKHIVAEACLLMSKRKSYHPVKKFIESEKWDGVVRLDDWLLKSVGCVDNKYTRDVSRKILIASVNRVYNPGCKFDHMLILEGGQGIGKSTLVEYLSGEFYLDTSFEHKDKDLVDSICQALIVEISELSGMTKKDIDWMKGFITRKVDRIRLPYTMRAKDFKRKCIFVGTYNPSGNNTYLRDDTGNRRFYPIECNKIDLEFLKENRSQLWAEAYQAYRNKELYYIHDKESLDILKGLHGDRELQSPTEIKIKTWLEQNKLREYVTMIEIIEDCLKISTDGKMPRDLVFVSSPVGIIMKKLGWEKGNNENRDKYFNPNMAKEVWGD